jgi:hypothetical protein
MNATVNTQINFTRPDTIGSVTGPSLLPNAGFYVATFAHLLRIGEALPIDRLANRIEHHNPNDTDCMEAVFTLRLWDELFRYAEDSVVNHRQLPDDFTYKGVRYDDDQCVTILGERAVAFLTETRPTLNDVGDPEATASVTLTIEQLDELLLAAESVSWENLDFTSAVSVLNKAKQNLLIAKVRRNQH